ncbi:hypothetical protein RRG08_045258 [Elysia crispata]|uniref:Uncharacterized protein n=1 Tax=Elysia crispata TaxID=231223 RepID=A0AAE1A233_9GAST|nr:hypothetical protein RRG08_045258 [Elysia crispata]
MEGTNIIVLVRILSNTETTSELNYNVAGSNIQYISPVELLYGDQLQPRARAWPTTLCQCDLHYKARSRACQRQLKTDAPLDQSTLDVILHLSAGRKTASVLAPDRD